MGKYIKLATSDFSNNNLGTTTLTALLETPKNNIYTSIGDSITASSSWEYNGILTEKYGLTLINLAKNGSSIDYQISGEGKSLYEQVLQIDTNSKYITVMIGVNDGGNSSWGDVVNAMKLTFDESVDIMTSDFLSNYGTLGRFSWCLKYLLNKCPKAKILVITPTKTNNTTYETDTHLPTLRLAEQIIALYLGIDCWVPTNETPFKTWDSKYYVDNNTDGIGDDIIHPNSLLHSMLATRIADLLDLEVIENEIIYSSTNSTDNVIITSDFTTTHDADVAASANGVKGIYDDVEALKIAVPCAISTNKKYVAIGDSITANTAMDYCGKLGLTLTDIAQSEAKIVTEWTDASTDDGKAYGSDLYSQVKSTSIPSDVKYITIMFGTNDGGASTSTTSDFNHTYGTLAKALSVIDNYTGSEVANDRDFILNYGVIGVFAWCMMYLKTTYPNAKILVITPPKTVDTSPYEATTHLPTLRSWERAVSLYLGIECFVPTQEYPFNTYNSDLYLSGDTIHPNEYWHTMLATRLKEILNLS